MLAPSCVRIQSWSNPNVARNGIPMGTTATNNNARVWNEQSDKIMGFRQPENNVVISGSDILNSTIHADVIARQTVTTSGNVNITSDKMVSVRAGNSITLSPGFVAAQGSVFTAMIENVSDCGSDPIYVESWTNSGCTGRAFQFNVANASSYNVKILSRTGSTVYSSSGSITGNSVTVWNVPSSLTNGVYYIEIKFSSQFYEESRAYAITILNCSSKTTQMLETENETLLKSFTGDQQLNSNLESIAQQEILPVDQFDFTIHPNPTDGYFTLTLDVKELQSFWVEIINPSLVPLFKKEYKNTNQITVEQRDLQPGVYYVKLTMGANVSVKRLVIN